MAGIVRNCGLFFWLAMVCMSPASSAADTLSDQRTQFAQAWQALYQRHMTAYHTLKRKLGAYPLYPYLEIGEAELRLKQGDAQGVDDVLARYADIPASRSLRIHWVRYLAAHAQWSRVRAQMGAHPYLRRVLPEAYLQAHWRALPREEMLRDFARYWLAGGSVGKALAAFERQWRSAGHPTRDECWTRIVHLVRKGDWRQAKLLSTELPKVEQGWFRQWRDLAARPSRLRQWDAWPDRALARAVVVDVLVRLARGDAEAGWRELARWRDVLGADEFLRLQRKIALYAAKAHRLVARHWLAALPRDAQTHETYAWQARLALLAQDWRGLLAVLDRMPVRQARKACWIYWRAQALKHLHQPRKARELLATIADERGFYSFRAAKELGRPYALHARSPQADERMKLQLATMPPMLRAREWWLLHEPGRAASEWMLAMRHATAAQWRAAAALARAWGWHAMTIRAAAKAGDFDALAARFPLAFADDVRAASKATKLDASTIWSIIRQESAFNARAVSRTGARGLMQLMPATARHVARRLRLGKAGDLFDPTLNIRLGSAYLADMLHRFGRLEYAMAAYNAGPSRVQRWLQSVSVADPLVWVEAIPYNETRRYVQQAMAFRVVYDWRQQQANSLRPARQVAEQEKNQSSAL
ncbi:MAG: lytic murein transglycosylase [Zetaproteobacteria bacterium]|nr:MAG: lytic murein transglycosylase [Zetaproteobacteria bacterium]